jgi:hypothetical protein
MALKEKVTTTRKKILLKGTLSDLILVWPHTSVYYHFISFFFSFSQCPSLSTKIGFGYFHNRLKNIFFPNRKGGKSPWMEVSIVGDSHTLSLCATLCKRQRNPHTNDGLMCVSFLWVGGCVWYEIIPFRRNEIKGWLPTTRFTHYPWEGLMVLHDFFIFLLHLVFWFRMPVLSSHSVLLSVQGSYN